MNEFQVQKNLRSLRIRRNQIFSLEQIEKANALLKSGKNATGDIGDTDLGTDLAEQEVALILTAMESNELAKIDAALERVRIGTYGICEVCGEPIAEKRLALTPDSPSASGSRSPLLAKSMFSNL